MLMMIEGNKGNMSIMWGERKKEEKEHIENNCLWIRLSIGFVNRFPNNIKY